MKLKAVIARLEELCDPYGNLEFAIGSGDDFICFDYAYEGTTMLIKSTVNSETGAFIQAFEPDRIIERIDTPHGALEARCHARRLVHAALDWCADGDNPVRLDMKGWNQDPAYFVRAVAHAVDPDDTRPVRRRVRNWRDYL